MQLKPRLRAHVRAAATTGDGDAAARTVTAQLYHEWLQNGLIQAGAGALHDHFCKQGLWVATGAGERPFKIFGDDRMLSAGAGEGVAVRRPDRAHVAGQHPHRAGPWAARGGAADDRHASSTASRATSCRSSRTRAAVYKAKEFGLDQFKPPPGQPISLANWHTQLEGYMTGSYLKSLFSTWSRHFVSQTPATAELVPFQLVSPHAGAEF